MRITFVGAGVVKLGIEAPPQVKILRPEIRNKIRQ